MWQLHRRCTLAPPDAAQLRPCERFLRKAGPLRVLTSRDKNALRLVRGFGACVCVCGGGWSLCARAAALDT